MASAQRLLIVDDNVDDRELLRRYLASIGYDIVCTASGASALALLSRTPVDMVLLDIGMPGADGIEVLGRIKQSASLKTIPVIMVTARNNDADIILSLERGAADYIVKPVRLPVVRARIAAHLARKAAEAASSAAMIDVQKTVAELESAIATAEAAVAARAEFMATVSHEIRTPLNGILGIASVFRRDNLDDRQTEMLSLIVDSGNSLERLLTELLEAARLEAGKMEVENRPIDLRHLIESSARLFEPAAALRGLTVEVSVSDCLPAQVVGDAGRISQILNNLIGNAVKFTETGGVRCVLEVVGQGEAYSISITDTGPGFDPSVAETLFERFRQADSGVARRHGGSGLGLQISRALAELMGGTLTATGRPGAGATFTLVLPMIRDNAQSGAVTTQGQPGAAASRRRVLIVDDNAANRLVLEMMLASSGHDILAVENGAKAVDAVRDSHFDLILMDLQMPVMDGLTAIRAICGGGASAPPIIVVSANGSAAEIAKCMAAGAVGHVAKPVSLEELLSAVDHWIMGSTGDVSVGALNGFPEHIGCASFC